MIGTILDERYRLEAELGRGGMGTVYRAHDTLLERAVAVKLLAEDGLGTEGRERMLREAQAIARLNHPNIVQVFDAGELDGTPFIVMELVEGPSLHERPPQDFPEIVAVTRQICAALEHAHTHGIIHRDLKPENVLIAPDGTAKLMDFGLARSMASRLTVEGQIAGTVFYLAPEVALGQAVEGRADLYALGVMLYELTTGVLPFSKGDPLAVISQHIHTSPLPPRSRNSAIPPLLEQLTLQLLSKVPDQRPDSAAALGRLLEQPSLLDPEAGTVREVSVLARIVRGRFEGRSNELMQVKSTWSQVCAGQGQALVISGEPGVGKSRLLREMVTQVEVTGGLALTGEAFQGGAAPYAPFGQVLRSALERADRMGIQLPKMNLADLLELAPELRPSYLDVAPNPSLSPEAEQHRQFESVVALISAVAGRVPVLVAIEDAHWADSGSLALLRHLARRLRRLPVLHVLTCREVELERAPELQEALIDLDRNRMATRLRLARFTRQETYDLLHAIFEEEITPQFLDGIYRETEGNAFFVEEVCKALVESGKLYFKDGRWHRPAMEDLEIPQSVRMAIEARVSGLPEATTEVLELASILGREFEYDTLAEASQVEEEALIAALGSAERAQLIEEANSGGRPRFKFGHALIPTSILEGIPTLRRRRLHRRAADALRRIRAENFEAIAYHYRGAGEPSLSLEYYTKAGERAARAYANPEAEHHLTAALDLVHDETERARLLGELALVLTRLGKFQLAIENWLEAIAICNWLGAHEQSAHYYARSIRAASEAGDSSRSLALGREALRDLEGAQDSKGLAHLYHEIGRTRYFSGQAMEAEPILRNALAMAEASGALDVRIEALITLAVYMASVANHPEEGRRTLLEAVELATNNQMPDEASRALNNLAVIENIFLADYTNSRDYYMRAAEFARATGDAPRELFYMANACGTSMEHGDLNWARERLPKLLAAQEELPAPGSSGENLKRVSGFLLRYSGELDAALMHFREMYQAGRNAGDVYVQTLFFAEVAIETRQQLDEALAMLEEAERGPKMWGARILSVLRARVLVAQGRLADARQALDRVRTESGGQPAGLDRMRFSLAEAELAVAEGNLKEAKRAYARTADFQRKAGLRWYRARTLWDWAEALIQEAGGRPTEEALKLLEEARDEFDGCGAPTYAERIQSRLQELQGLAGASEPNHPA